MLYSLIQTPKSPVSAGDAKEFFSALLGISWVFLVPFVAILVLWMVAHAKIAKKAGYPSVLGVIASLFPLMYFAFAFSRWPVEEKMLHLSGQRHKDSPLAPIAPNYRGKKKTSHKV